MSRIKTAGLLESVFFALGYLEVYLVEGESMVNTLMPGSKVLIDPRGTLSTGDIVIARHPYRTDLEICKRIKVLDEVKEALYLISDNPEGSTDSRTFGTVPIKYVKGKVVAILDDD